MLVRKSVYGIVLINNMGFAPWNKVLRSPHTALYLAGFESRVGPFNWYNVWGKLSE